MSTARAEPRLRRVETSPVGTTLHFQLAQAPFPAGDKPYRDATVLVFVPTYFRLPKRRRVDVVVHFHGHNTTVGEALAAHQLREQLFDSKQNAILIAPQLALRATDSHAGKLEREGGLARLLVEVLAELRRPAAEEALGKASLAGVKDVELVCLSAHSGGYRAAASCVARGGVDVGEVYLFDALYAQLGAFSRWAIERKDESGRKRHKLVSFYAGGSVSKNNERLREALTTAGVKVLVETKPGTLTRAELAQGRAIFIQSPLQHTQVTFRNNGLRDCLFASGLKRHLESDWFADKHEARRIDRR
ncbi:MAG: hypothetical protein R3B72_00620 [Polyangiaceae bacterium]